MEVYAEQTAPLTQVYGQRGKLTQVDGAGEIDEVTGRLTRALSELPG
jgi:adenylate kinase